MNSLKYILLTVASGLGVLCIGATNSISTSLESSIVEMGSYVNLEVQAVEPVGTPTEILRLTDMWPAQVELRPDSVIDIKEIGNGLQEITRIYKLQSFDSGVYVLPPFMHIVGSDTTLSNAITLKVNPIDVSHLTDIHPVASVMTIESKWYDFLPDWLTDYWGWIVAGVILLAAGIVTVLILTKRIKVPLLPKKKVEPPYDQAKRRLAILRQERLWEKGREKEYYSKLTDILRRYIGRRYNINALEMTSSQLLTTLKDIPELAEEISYVKAVLDTADFVKFAKMQPNPEVNVKAYDATDNFIENTRPVETPEAEKTLTTTEDSATQQPLKTKE